MINMIIKKNHELYCFNMPALAHTLARSMEDAINVFDNKDKEFVRELAHRLAFRTIRNLDDKIAKDEIDEEHSRYIDEVLAKEDEQNSN